MKYIKVWVVLCLWVFFICLVLFLFSGKLHSHSFRVYALQKPSKILDSEKKINHVAK